MKTNRKRIVSGFLAVMMIFGLMPVGALAADRDGGLCEHHPQHTADCGYAPATAGNPCAHQHTEDCYEVIANCTHTHTENCYPPPGGDTEEAPGGSEAPQEPETPGEPDPSEDDEHAVMPIPASMDAAPSACTHECTEASGCLGQVLNCAHAHDADCGYVPAEAGQSCTYVCELCGSESDEPWPEAPDWTGDPGQWKEPSVGDGMMEDEVYGQPMEMLAGGALDALRAESEAAAVNLDSEKQIPEGQLDYFTAVYINGEAYKEGDITVTEGDNFSYLHTWSPNPEAIEAAGEPWGDGSWFEIELFRVPGLNLPQKVESSLVINGIKVGERKLTYDWKSGEMTYQVVFNRYIQFFQPDTVVGMLQGSGKFSNIITDGTISVGDDSGKLTVEQRPEIPEIPSKPVGTGWKPAEAPKFNNNFYGFGKGTKWNSGSDPNRVPEIEWRVVFLEQLQKIQQDFLNGAELQESNGNLIITETLDANQRFYCPNPDNDKGGEEGKYKDNAPFFLELPVIVPGTGNILNPGIGNENTYDGPGIIEPVITGEQFEEIDGSTAVTPEAVKAVQKHVRETPLTWTVTTDPETRQQTLLINTGKLGTTDKTEGITWELQNGYSEKSKWPVNQLEWLINDCDNKISAIIGGTDSPISLLDNRQATLLNLLNNAAAMTDDPEEARAQIQKWRDDYRTWRDDKRVSPLTQLVDPNLPEDQQKPIVPLPLLDLVKGFEGWPVNNNGRKIKDCQEYVNYVASLEHLLADQSTYLANRRGYGEDWENAKKRYTEALDFYEDGRIYGFAIKLRSESINTAATSYQNSAQIEMDGKKWNADDTATVRFSSGIIGSYALGDIVVQKADARYDTSTEAEDNTTTDIQKVEKDGAGLAGAQFQVYCGVEDDVVPSLTHDNLAHFLERDASEGGNAYIYNHTGDDEHEGLITGEIETLDVNADGKLILRTLTPQHDHWLVETKAPDGYYLDKTPIQFNSELNEVAYDLVPNVSRSVILYKRDSFSGNPVAGAEFELVRVETGQDGAKTETPVTGFAEKNLNGHQTLVKKDGGTAKLRTNADGELCIHGLDAGSYVLRESVPAPGYLKPDAVQDFEFTLSDEIPALDANRQDAEQQTYDAEYHILLNTTENPLENDPGVASLTLNKQGVGTTKLEDAGFALFRFTGTEAQWRENPDRDEWWEAIDLSEKGGKYFKTTQKVEPVSAGTGGWQGNETLQAVFTDDTGSFTIEAIPVGHYSISELEAPDTYQRDYRSFYFTVDGDTVGKPVKLYTNPEQTTELSKGDGNTLKNYQQKAELALVKYDAAGDTPALNGAEIAGSGGWQYTEDVLSNDQSENYKGLEGAVYKLFMRRGASTGGGVNPDPEQLKTETILEYKPGYDTCVAVGTTGKDGVLRLSEMKGRNGNEIKSLNPEEYYMIEITPPEGYLLDQEPIHFVLDERVFPEDSDPNTIPGLVMAASNTKADYGLRLQKIDAKLMPAPEPLTGDAPQSETTGLEGLPGAVFTVQENEKPVYFLPQADGSYRYAAEGTPDCTDKVVTGKNGWLVLTGLKADTTYTLTEIQAPRGYKLPENPTFTMTTAASKQTGEWEEASGVIFQSERKLVPNEELKGVMTLHKQDAETNLPLAGAKFELYRTDTEIIPPEDPEFDPTNPGATRSEDVKLREGTTDESGNLTFDNLDWHQSYFVREIEAPPGYLLDQTKRMFSINENSFDKEGKPIPVLFPAVSNSRGTLGEAVLYKVDAETGKPLPNAHFYLEKKMGVDAQNREIWVGYGQGIYITSSENAAKGEIHFLLPPGDYKLTEMAAPDGYMLPENILQEYKFSIKETTDGSQPEMQEITVENRRGGTGVYLKKTIAGGIAGVPLKGVTFRFYQGMGSNEPLYFIDNGNGSYSYTETAEGATQDLVTNAKGEIFASFPAEFADAYTELNPKKFIYYEEISAPGNVEFEPGNKELIDNLRQKIWTNVNVVNHLKGEIQDQISITIHKKDGHSKLGLPGAEFELFTVLELDNEKFEIVVNTGTTDRNGDLVFNRGSSGNPLTPGEIYYLRETKAPNGYVLDQTVHEIKMDETRFDENLNFIPVALELYNYQIGGAVQLKKVSAEDHSKGLPGAEFELLRKAEGELDPAEDAHWEHYGETRYLTGEDGMLRIENLPYGSYMLIERAAPLGYLLDDPAQTLTFQIVENEKTVELGMVTNRVDPNPVRDVLVHKIAKDDPDKGLEGAEFQLYVKEADGTYRLRQDQTYITGKDGRVTIQGLPVGNYALKEIKAPAGYDVPEEDMTYFAVRVDEREVRLTIENARSSHGGGGGGGGGSSTVSVSVEKVWEDADAEQRPDSVRVQLYRNREPYGPPVTLDAENNWKYVWRSLDGSDTWVVDEVEVPEGYDKTVSHKGNAWTITNTAASSIPIVPIEPIDPEKPVDPNQPADPTDPSVPTEPGEPGDPSEPGKLDVPGGPASPDAPDPADPDAPWKPEGPADHVPRTGDDSHPLLWAALMCLSAAGFALVWRSGKRRTR